MNRSAVRHTLRWGRAAAVLAALMLLTGSFALAENWPTYRGNIARTGVTSETLAPLLNLAWRFEADYPPIPAWPMPSEEMPRMHYDNAYHATIADGLVFFASSVTDRVYALNKNTGKIRWTFQADGPVRFAPTWWDGRLYFGSDDGMVYCLNASTGKWQWKFRAGPNRQRLLGNGRMISMWPVRTSVLVDRDAAGIPTVYFSAGVFPYEGLYITALRALDGSMLWQNDTIGDRAHDLQFGGISPQSYLVASDDTLYVPSGRAMPAAFDRNTGEFLYFAPTSGKQGGVWALLDEDRLIAGVDRSGTPAKVAIDPETGAIEGDVYAWFPGVDMVTANDFVYSLTRDGVVKIDRKVYPEAAATAEENARRRRDLSQELADLRERLETADEELAEGLRQQIDTVNEALSTVLEDQDEVLKRSTWDWKFEREGLTALVLAGQTVYAGGENVLIAIDAGTGKKAWEHSLDGTVAGISAGDGVLVASTDCGKVYGFTPAEAAGPMVITASRDASPFGWTPRSGRYDEALDLVLSESPANAGYCLVLDAGEGRLAADIALNTNYDVIALTPSTEKRDAARRNLALLGLPAARVTVQSWNLETLPDYFADFIVSESMLLDGTTAYPPEQVCRVLRPCGGVAYFGIPGPRVSSNVSKDLEQILAWTKNHIGEGYLIERESGFEARIVRQALPGSGAWTSLYGNPQQTACSDDQLVRGPLGILWYGNPGPQGMVERHGRAMGPVAIDGRLFVQGEEVIRAYNAYNGTELWRREITGAVRARVDVDGGNLALNSRGLYVAANEKCHRLDPATGETVREISMPSPPDNTARRWGFIAVDDQRLYGTTAYPVLNDYGHLWKLLEEYGGWPEDEEALNRALGLDENTPEAVLERTKRYLASYPGADVPTWQGMQRGGTLWRLVADFPSWGSQANPRDALTDRLMAGDSVFAIDPDDGSETWVYRGTDIANIAVALGNDGFIYFAERGVSDAERNEAMQLHTEWTHAGLYEQSVEADLTPEERDIRRVVALHADTGEVAWTRAVDLTGCGGDKMSLTFADGLLLFYGSFSNHDTGYFLGNQLRWRRVTALAAQPEEGGLAAGDLVWSRPLNYLRRPLVVGDRLIIEPRAADLRTGRIVTRAHPVTGRESPWEFLRPGHCCAITAASPHMLFYRSYFTAIYDMVRDSGLQLFGGMRLGCWLNAISANGVVMMPEASAGCTCSFPLRTTVVMKNKPYKEPAPFAVMINHGPNTPLEHLALNLGAPGDIRDDSGRLWLAWPRPKTVSNVGYGAYAMELDVEDELAPDRHYYHVDHRARTYPGTDEPWRYSSGCYGLRKLRVHVNEPVWGEPDGVFTIRLGFLAPVGDEPGRRVFDIAAADTVLVEGFDPVVAAGGPGRAGVREITGVPARGWLELEFRPRVQDPTLREEVLLQSIEILREGAPVEVAGSAADTPELSTEEAEKRLREGGLANFHAVLAGARDDGFRLRALRGMAGIGSLESVPWLAPFVRDTDPILRNYEQISSDVGQAAVEAFLAIAGKQLEQDPALGVRMLRHAIELPGGESVRGQIADHSLAYARGVGAEHREEAVRVLREALAITKDFERRANLIGALRDLGVHVDAQARAEGFLTDWLLLGAIPVPSDAQRMEEMVLTEYIDIDRAFQAKAGHTVDVGETRLTWRPLTASDWFIPLDALLEPNTDAIAYACADFELPGDMEIGLKIGSDDGFKCWLNGREVGGEAASRGCEPDQNVFVLKGRKGANRLLVKVCQGGNEWAVAARVVDTENRAIDGLQ